MITPLQEAVHTLRGADIIIGKDEKNGKLLISTAIKGKRINVNVGTPGSVPSCVSRCKPNENIGHCRLTIGSDGYMTIANLKQQNVTYVNGMPIIQCGFDPNSIVQLGCNMFNLNVGQILMDVKNAVGKVLPPEYPITHLEDVWEQYREDVNVIKKRQKRLGVIRSSSMIFTVGGGLFAALGQYIVDEVPVWARLLPMGIALAIMLYSLIALSKDKSSEQMEELADALQDDYVCPNPQCRNFVGMQPYKVLRQKRGCPYCKCQWTS